MGFFSWNCKGCGESIKAPYGLPRSIAWQNDAVWLLPNNDRLSGNYDGYGRIGTISILDQVDDPELWHRECWVKADEPDYTGPSDYALDQGYFYDHGDDEKEGCET